MILKEFKVKRENKGDYGEELGLMCTCTAAKIFRKTVADLKLKFGDKEDYCNHINKIKNYLLNFNRNQAIK